MKKVLVFVVSVMTVLLACSCSQKQSLGPINNPVGGGLNQEESAVDTTSSDSNDSDSIEQTLGQYVETDALKITLVYAKLTKSSTPPRTIDDDDDYTTQVNYFTCLPTELISSLGEVMPQAGYTRVVIEYLAENLSDTDIEFDGKNNTPLFQLKYKDEIYDCHTQYVCTSTDDSKWYSYTDNSATVPANEERYYRCCVDLPFLADDYEDDFLLALSMPDSKGKILKRLFVVTRDARVDGPELYFATRFLELGPVSTPYLEANKDKFDLATSDELTYSLYGNRWDLKRIVVRNSYVSNTYIFDENYKIKEHVIYNGKDTFDNLHDYSWSVEGSNLILNFESSDMEYEMRKIRDDFFVGYQDGEVALTLLKSDDES